MSLWLIVMLILVFTLPLARYFIGLPVIFCWFAVRWLRWNANLTTDDTTDFLDDPRDHRYTGGETRRHSLAGVPPARQAADEMHAPRKGVV